VSHTDATENPGFQRLATGNAATVAIETACCGAACKEEVHGLGDIFMMVILTINPIYDTLSKGSCL
jgi:hypothetical protein